ncbi:MAG TPA: DNA polymerase III subunit gamma and tau [Ornithinimicrobium sp.]|uniref:DNA polymerase III subunit gamma and tau n=1 Tax=Ornithinimicrobium sp. TaxID=1977084 RepID=UPI002B48F1F4|nr:DNA polymerase III subunit gamma and tau [Ornithinimicrobium sp.]HKJ12346.1 DNA polymerase III subunit gamma and tau [Ornithinimicrobium sp.]
MSTALYRRYRPETFADVIGQEHVTQPLRQALLNARVHHAYLFSGPRGCGKTTSARILARCLNCAQGPTPDPCGNCDSCVALARGGAGTVDVIEIDAASHGGVDDARDLRERAAFGPAQSRYKVYIIDEAHMVTAHGFNALLKVVEEPPEHVKFIFATTEPEKVLSTIRSRTHHYPFHLVPPQRLTGYLEQMCAVEGIDAEPGVLSFVTRAGAGSVRDSLSVLDQLISGAGDQGLTYERTASLLGFTDTELLDAVVTAVAAGDAASVFTQVDKVVESGHDPRRFAEDLLERYRDLIVLLAVGERAASLLPGASADQVERMAMQARSYGAGALSRCADVVSQALAEMTGAVSHRLQLELVCARLLLPGAAGEGGYAARLDRMERRLAAADHAPGQRGDPQPAGQASSSAHAPAAPAARADQPRSPVEPERTREHEPPVQEEPPVEPEPGPEPPAQAEPAVEPGPAPASAAPDPPGPVAQDDAGRVSASHARGTGVLDTDAIRRSWPEVLDRIKAIRRVTWTLVSVNTTVVDFDGRRLLLEVDTAGQTESFRRGNHAEVVRQALIEAIGLDTTVEGVAAGGGHGEREPRQPRTRREDPSPERPRQPRRRRSDAAPGPATDEPGAVAPARAADVPSADDDDLDGATTVGQPVIESVLGGRVIAIDDGSQR